VTKEGCERKREVSEIDLRFGDIDEGVDEIRGSLDALVEEDVSLRAAHSKQKENITDEDGVNMELRGKEGNQIRNSNTKVDFIPSRGEEAV
jgi:hypothetical protein